MIRSKKIARLLAAVSLSICTGGARGLAAEDFLSTATAISAALHAHLYRPGILEDPEFKALEQRVVELAKTARTREEFVEGFNRLWRGGPFSHVQLQVAKASAEETATFLDGMRVGGSGAVLTWRDDVAVLTVSTMMGLDTIEAIDAAYGEIVRRQGRALIVDLRRNKGGAFAVKPLVGHAIETPLDAGVFVSQPWAAEHSDYPSRTEAAAVEPWIGWSIVAFWRDVQNQRMTRIRFEPMVPTFTKPIFVLVSRETASAAELAADALQASGRAVLIGETTAGEMLSQKMYDVPGGLLLSLPVADYYAFHSGRIEGRGVQPDVRVTAAEALDVALDRARRTSPAP